MPLSAEGCHQMLSTLEHTATMRVIDLSCAGLSGSIPVALAKIETLTLINLRENNLTGPIPPQLCAQPALRGLSLGCNSITKEIPPQLGESQLGSL